MKRIWLLAILLGVWPIQGTAQTTEELLNDGQNTENVLLHSMGYDRKSYSPLDQINRSNVKRLVPIWNASLMNNLGELAAPVIYDGVMYVINGAWTFAIDVETGRQMTQFSGGRGKVVWLPTLDAEYFVTTDGSDLPYVSVVTDGKPAPELAEIFQIIAENDLVLATGHSSPDEVLLLLPEARSLGVRNILITHVLSQNPTREQIERMVDHGAIMELVYPGVRRFTIEDYVEVITAIGAQHFLISSDLGQYLNPLHTDGLKAFIDALRDQGISESDIDMMARRNPARLLGLDP